MAAAIWIPYFVFYVLKWCITYSIDKYSILFYSIPALFYSIPALFYSIKLYFYENYASCFHWVQGRAVNNKLEVIWKKAGASRLEKQSWNFPREIEENQDEIQE